MVTKTASDLTSKNVSNPHRGNAVTYFGAVTETPATGDKWNLAIIPAGVLVTDVSYSNADLGTAAPATLQLAPVDGSTATALSTTDGLALGTASTGAALVPAAAVRTTEDCYLQLLFGTINTGNSGVVTVVLRGEGVGAA
jgi:hypothetical protein